jgi:PAS domain S-box-containing protein
MSLDRPPKGRVAPVRHASGFSERLAEAILSMHSDAIVGTDRDGIIRFWNPGAERVFGHSRDEAVGRSLDLIIPERLRQRHWQGYAQTMRTGRTRYGESDLLSVPAIRKDGATISVQFTIVSLKQAEKMIGLAAVIRDVTKQYQEVRALKRALAGRETAAVDDLRP